MAVELREKDQCTRYAGWKRILNSLQNEVDLGLQNDLVVLVFKRENDLGARYIQTQRERSFKFRPRLAATHAGLSDQLW